MLRRRYERVNALAELNGAARYLEIGVAQGKTFLRVDVEHKTAVDPKFRFDTAAHADDRTVFFPMTSDRYFAEYAGDSAPFDVIYLDGLHTFEQTFRDFCATLSLSHPKTLWLIDDTRPVSYASSLRNLRDARLVREATGDESPLWMGDVYKVVFAIHDFFPQFSFATFPGHGQTAVWREPRLAFEPRWNSLADISGVDFAGFLDVADEVMNTLPPTRLLQLVATALERVPSD